MSLNIKTVFLFVNDYEAIYFQLEIPTKYYLVWVMWCNSRAIVRASHMMKFRKEKLLSSLCIWLCTIFSYLFFFLVYLRETIIGQRVHTFYVNVFCHLTCWYMQQNINKYIVHSKMTISGFLMGINLILMNLWCASMKNYIR